MPTTAGEHFVGSRNWSRTMGDTKIIIKNLGQADYALLSKELGAQNISPVSVDRVPGKFGEPVTISLVLAVAAATSVTAISIGIAAWLMKKSDKDEVTQEFYIEHPDGRIERRIFNHKKRSESATDPELLKALKDMLPNFPSN
jgi:ActR/RegA family two-component response regulator